MSLPLEEYALLSDCHSAALVSREGSIDWLCLPHFDSPACFAALLGKEDNGYWAIRPAGRFHASRRYVDGTLVLETRFEAAGGSCTLTDCMVLDREHPTLVREVEGITGRVAMEMALFIRFDYGSIVPWVRRVKPDATVIRAVAGPDALLVSSSVPLHGRNWHTEAAFSVAAGERVSFTITWYPPSTTQPHPPDHPHHLVRRSVYLWREWSDRSQYQGRDKTAVDRSLLTLKALTFEPTGGIVAAPTTSLPEQLGGPRNWDYRYCWLRDATFTLYSLLTAGYREEAEKWRRWLLRAVAGTPEQVNIMYGLSGQRRLTEVELPWLCGYEKSQPVRIGNAAHTQLQIDVFGEVMDTLHLAARRGLPPSEDAWRIQEKMIECLGDLWQKPDEGIWEIRGPRRPFTHSKVMAWVAVDRAIKAMDYSDLRGPRAAWVALRKRIYDDVCTHAFDSRLNSFVQSYGSKELDASLLIMGLVGFLQPDDPRLHGTVVAIQRHLMKDGLVLRYRSRAGFDGLTGGEGVFLACSFWLADTLVLIGKTEEAKELFERVIALRNDVGLLAEEYSPERGRMVGNYPQAFSHVSHVNTASNLSHAKGPAGDRCDSGLQLASTEAPVNPGTLSSA